MIFSTHDRDPLTTCIREGAHLTTDEYVSTLFFEVKGIRVREISLTDLIGSSFLSVGGGFSSRRICRLRTAF